MISMLALRSGWRRDEVARSGGQGPWRRQDRRADQSRPGGRGGPGHVSDLAWARATASGWTGEQLAEAFAYLGLTVFTSYFLNYAATELDIPAGGSDGIGPGTHRDRRRRAGLAAFYAGLLRTP